MVGTAMAVGAALGAGGSIFSTISTNRQAKKTYETQVRQIQENLKLNLARLDYARQQTEQELALGRVEEQFTLASQQATSNVMMTQQGVTGATAEEIYRDSEMQSSFRVNAMHRKADSQMREIEQQMNDQKLQASHAERQAYAKKEAVRKDFAEGAMSAIQGGAKGAMAGASLGSGLATPTASTTAPLVGTAGAGNSEYVRYTDNFSPQTKIMPRAEYNLNQRMLQGNQSPVPQPAQWW